MHSLRAPAARAIAALIAIVLTGSVVDARATTFIVNSTEDDPPGPCDAVVGGCTLREAITATVATPGRDTIHFDPTVFPFGAPATILVTTPLPTIADPTGTVLDGVGAGVMIGQILTGGGTETIDGLLFATAPGVSLANVTVANLTVQGFPGAGVHICGGTPPECEEDLSAPLVQNVVVIRNEDAGIEIEGRIVRRARIIDSVAVENGDVGILCDASQSIAGARVERCAARDNGRHGIIVGGNAVEVTDTAITDSIAVGNTAGIAVAAIDRIAKTRLTNLGAVNNRSSGIVVETFGEASGTRITNAVASGNDAEGIGVLADMVSGASLRDVAGNGNRLGIVLNGEIAVMGAKITRAAAVGNEFDGIRLRHATGARIDRASVVGNGVSGLRVIGSGNLLKRVRASENQQDGIRLEGPGSGNRVEKSSGTANQGPGISIGAGSTANTVQNNVALGNDAIDLLDDNAACDANVWKNNAFERRNEPCIQ